MKSCPKCGSEHSKPGAFCSRKCANSRTWNEEDKLKKSNSNIEFARAQGIVPVKERPKRIKAERVEKPPREDKGSSNMAQYMEKRRTERNAWAMAYLGGKCAWCGSTERLQYDHIDRKTKSFTISPRGFDVGFAKFKVEIDKCQLLCFPCHVEKSRQEISEMMKEKYEDQEYREKQGEFLRSLAWSQKGVIRGPHSEERKARIAKSVRKAWEDGKYDEVFVRRI